MNKFKLFLFSFVSLVSQLGFAQNNFQIDKSLYIKADTIEIAIETGEKKSFTKAEFNKIVDNFPELYHYPPQNPFETYDNSRFLKDSVASFYSSEGGMDTYFVFYAYFLKQANTSQKLIKERANLVEVALTINRIKCFLGGGGTFYTHFARRVLASVEYQVFLISKNDSALKASSAYREQKKQFIDGFKKQILNCETSEIDSIEKSIFSSKPQTLKSIKKEIKGDKELIDQYFEDEIKNGIGVMAEGIDIEIETSKKIDIYKKRLMLEAVKQLEQKITSNYYFKWAEFIDKSII